MNPKWKEKYQILLFSALCWLSDIVLILSYNTLLYKHSLLAFTLELTAEDRLIGAALCSVMLQWAGISFQKMPCFVNWHLWVLGCLFCCWLQDFCAQSPTGLLLFFSTKMFWTWQCYQLKKGVLENMKYYVHIFAWEYASYSWIWKWKSAWNRVWLCTSVFKRELHLFSIALLWLCGTHDGRFKQKWWKLMQHNQKYHLFFIPCIRLPC